MAQPLISVVIPCYNREAYIREAVDSALNQTWPNIEIIVVDDGSSDGSADILRSYGDKITLIIQPNAGVAAARNTGITASRGEWIALLDSDDIWRPEKLSSQMALAARYPEAVLIHARCSTIDSKGQVFGDAVEVHSDALEVDSLERLLHHCEPTTSSVIIRSDQLRVSGPFDVDFEQHGGFAAEDWELYIRLAELGPFAVVGRDLTIYRVHTDSKSVGNRLRHTLGLVHIRKRIEGKKNLWLATRPRPSIDNALKQHREQYAHVLGRLGLLYLKDRNWGQAKEAFQTAVDLEPGRIKHRARLALASIQMVFG